MAISHVIFQLILDSFAVIDLKTYSRVSVIGDDDSEVRLQKLKMMDPMWHSHTQNSIIFLL